MIKNDEAYMNLFLEEERLGSTKWKKKYLLDRID